MKWGGDLVTIRSPYENTYLANQMTKRKMDRAWIGLNDEKVEGKFVWVSGVQNFYTNWHGETKEPNGGRRENCGETVAGYNWNGAWNDNICGIQNNFICEKMM